MQKQMIQGFKPDKIKIRIKKVCFCGKRIKDIELDYCSEEHKKYAIEMNRQLLHYLYINQPANKERIKEYTREYHKSYYKRPEVMEKNRKNLKRYYKKNRKKLLKKSRAYYNKNKVKRLKKMSEYYYKKKENLK